MALKRYCDNLIRYIGPVLVSTNTALDESNTDSVTLRAYVENFAMTSIRASTRTLDADVAIGAGTFTMPYFPIQWLEVGDEIEWTNEFGERRTAAITVVTPGTDRHTEATNSTAVTFSPVNADILSENTEIRMIKKGVDNGKIPVELAADAPTGASLQAEIETDDVGGDQTVAIDADDPVPWVEATSLGETAPNQDRFRILDVTGLSGGGPISPGRRVRVKLGADITMDEYGTPVAGADDYGFEAILPDTVTPTKVAQGIRLEVTCIATTGPTQDIDSIVEIYAAA